MNVPRGESPRPPDPLEGEGKADGGETHRPKPFPDTTWKRFAGDFNYSHFLAGVVLPARETMKKLGGTRRLGQGWGPVAQEYGKQLKTGGINRWHTVWWSGL